MRYMNVIKNINDLNVGNLSDYEDEINYIEKSFTDRSINVPEPMETSFCNHLVMMLYRINKQEYSDVEVSGAALDEIDSDTWQAVDEIIDPLFTKRNLEPNKVEKVLFAFYIQASK